MKRSLFLLEIQVFLEQKTYFQSGMSLSRPRMTVILEENDPRLKQKYLYLAQKDPLRKRNHRLLG